MKIKTIIAIPATKTRDPIAFELRRPGGLYGSKIQRDRTKYDRKIKHKNKE